VSVSAAIVTQLVIRLYLVGIALVAAEPIRPWVPLID
jgi:hypothetical protein